MGPDGDPRRAAAGEVPGEREERLGHVAVADVPGLVPAPEPRAVVGRGVLGEPRVLLGVEAVVLGGAQAPGRGGPELRERLQDRALAARGEAEARGVAVALDVPAEVLEAGVAVADARGGLRVLAREVADDLGDRG